VLFIHGITELGGAEQELLLYLEHLPRDVYTAVLACPGGGLLTERAGKLGITQRSVNLPSWRKTGSLLRRWSAVRELRSVIEKEQPDLIHVNDIWWVPQTLRAAAGFEVPVVAHVRQEIEMPKVHRYELGRPDLVLAISSQVRKSLVAAGVVPERLVTLYSGLDLVKLQDCADVRGCRQQLGISDEALVLGTVANLFPRKGYEVMLEALPAIRSSCPKAEYVIVGTGDSKFEQRLQTAVRERGLERAVHFLGFQESVYPCLAAMDLYVHPALMEGFGIAVLEAMALRKAVVASRTGGIPEIVREGETGLLVPPGEAGALAQAVTTLLNDSARRIRMGLAGRVRIESAFSVDIMMNGLASAYDRLSSHLAH